MGTKRVWAAVAIAAFAAVGAWLFLGTAPAAAPQSTFVLLDATKRSTEDLRGKVTLVNFWATSCTTCVAEMPELIATHQKYHAQGFDTLAVAMSYDPPSYVVNFVETRKLPFQVALDNTGAVAKAWGDVRITPTTYIVNKQGQIVKTYVGNPNLLPETAHTLSATADWHDASGQRWGVRLTPWISQVHNYIDAKRCSGGSGMMSVCNAANLTAQQKFVYLRFANADARLWGFDVSGFMDLGRNDWLGALRLDGAISQTRGRNRDTGEFEHVSWDAAIADIGARLRRTIAATGPGSRGST